MKSIIFISEPDIPSNKACLALSIAVLPPITIALFPSLRATFGISL